MIKKIHLAKPTMSLERMKQHEKAYKKLRKLLAFKSMRQSMIASARNFYVTHFLLLSKDDVESAANIYYKGGSEQKGKRTQSQFRKRRIQVEEPTT